ncbi:hypothetical protein ACHWQZ_G001803 [Mnemiopsis leidyi]
MAVNIAAFNTDSLVTPSPYHIPGYGGYIPQRKYKIGGTFSKTTHEILTDKDNSSGNLVLRKIEPVKEKTPQFRSNLVPGYTGYIPKGEHWFALPYVTACSYAKGDHLKSLKSQAEEKQRFLENQLRAVPLNPIKSSADPFVSKQSSYKTHTIDYHISGYTGFLPMSRNKISMGYPSMTKQAIADYREKERLQAATKSHVPFLEKPAEKPVLNRRVLYPAGSGMVPHYTGHIPGEKFKYGNTFGTSTNAALKSMHCYSQVNK